MGGGSGAGGMPACQSLPWMNGQRAVNRLPMNLIRGRQEKVPLGSQFG
jgi:hypothetical protein